MEYPDTRGPATARSRTKRGFLALLLVFVLAGLAGLLGVRTTTASDDAEGWSSHLRHAQVARAGLDVPWEVTVPTTVASARRSSSR